MSTLQVDILDPKARKLLNELADKKLISIREDKSKEKLFEIIKKVRARAKSKPITLAQITKEVEVVRAKRYAKKKQKGNP